MLSSVYRRVRKMIRPVRNIKAIECALVAEMLWWAFLLALPISTFHSSSSFEAMATLASEQVWALGFFFAGMTNLYGMLFKKKAIRAIGLVTTAGLLLFITIMFAYSNVATTGTGTYFILFCLNAFVVYKVGEQHGS